MRVYASSKTRRKPEPVVDPSVDAGGAHARQYNSRNKDEQPNGLQAFTVVAGRHGQGPPLHGKTSSQCRRTQFVNMPSRM